MVGLVCSIRWASSAQKERNNSSAKTLEACRNLRSDRNTLKYLRGISSNVCDIRDVLLNPSQEFRLKKMKCSYSDWIRSGIRKTERSYFERVAV